MTAENGRAADWTPAERATLIRLYNEGRSAREIAEELPGRTARAVKHQTWALQNRGLISQRAPAYVVGMPKTAEDHKDPCAVHAAALMREGGFCAFSSVANPRADLGVCLPMIWPKAA